MALHCVLLDTSQQVFTAVDLKNLIPTALDQEIIFLLQSQWSRRGMEEKLAYLITNISVEQQERKAGTLLWLLSPICNLSFCSHLSTICHVIVAM